MPIAILPIFIDELRELSSSISVGVDKTGRVVYYCGIAPIYMHHKDDLMSFKMITSQLHASGHCKQMDIVRFFEVTNQSVKRAYKLYCDRGPGSFFDKPVLTKKGGRPPIFTKEVLEEAQSKLDSGESRGAVAKALGIKPNTFGKAILAGKLQVKKK